MCQLHEGVAVLPGGPIAVVIFVIGQSVTSDLTQLVKAVQVWAYQGRVRRMPDLTVMQILTSFEMTWAIPEVVIRVATTLAQGFYHLEVVQ